MQSVASGRHHSEYQRAFLGLITDRRVHVHGKWKERRKNQRRGDVSSLVEVRKKLRVGSGVCWKGRLGFLAVLRET